MTGEKPIRGRGREWGLAVALAMACAPFVAGVLYFVHSLGPSEADIVSLKAEGQTLIDAAERCRARAGRYPATLEDAGLSAPWTWYGRWRYGSDGATFFVEVGDYSRDGFLLMWTDDGWMLDR